MTNDVFSAEVRRAGAASVIDFHGRIDGDADPELGDAYTTADGSGPVLLNFSDVSYINSTGIALIVQVLARARKAQRQMQAFGLTDHYREIFELTRLADFMEIFPDEETALAGAVTGGTGGEA